MLPSEFTKYFMHKYTSLISNIGRRYLIPNRYNLDDIKQYISERILKILLARQNGSNKILDPEKYFKSTIEFYCIEYQRMHGFVFELPKRPRKNCEEDEKSARSQGFKYLKDLTIDEINSLYDMTLDKTISENLVSDPETTVWTMLTGCLRPNEADVIACIYMRNMTWAETSEYLEVPQSTCWFRKNRAVKRIQEAIYGISGIVADNIKQLIRGQSGKIKEFYDSQNLE